MTYTFTDPQCIGSDSLWSGDTDYSGLVRNFDLLNIGLSYSDKGPPRDVQGIEWTSLAADDWDKTFCQWP